MAGLGDVFGEGSTARQLLVWQVLAQVIAALAAPGFTELAKLSNQAAPLAPLDPGIAATLTARGFQSEGEGESQANDSGFGHDVFVNMVKAAQRGPDLSAAFELYRRKLIPEGSADPTQASLRGALADAGIPEYWHDALVQVATSIPTQAEVLNAWLEGQIPESEARHRLLEAGMDPSWIQSAYDANGQAPTPTQALELLNRGIIPERGTGPQSVSYQQSFLEGPWRNKWLEPFLALAEYLPPPRTVTAMYHSGQLDHARAAELLAKQGLAPDLVEAYLAKTTTSSAPTEHHLAKTEVTTAYADGILSKAEALAGLRALKYSEHDAQLVLQLVDIKVKASQLNQGVTRTRTLYQSGKLTEAEARNLLVKLGLDADQARAVVSTWHITATHTTKTLSASQIEAAVYYELLRPEDGIKMLRALGYDEFDAWMSLAIRLHGTSGLPPRPAGPPAPRTTPPPPLPGA